MQARLLLSCCAVLPLLAAAPPGPVWPETEPLSSALATGRVQAEEMRGREVFTFDETRIGTLLRALPQAVIRLDPSRIACRWASPGCGWPPRTGCCWT
jgi:hypothetical protein